METLAPSIIVQILGGNTMTALRKAKREGHSAWTGVVSLERPTTAYRNSVDLDIPCSLQVRTFEIPDDALKYEDIDDSAILDGVRFKVHGFQELQALLYRLGVDPAVLAFKADTGYPL
jgi:hypothetical protein